MSAQDSVETSDIIDITDTEDVPAGNTQEPEVNGIGIHEMELNEIDDDNKAEIQKLVSQALESKLTGFQTQMQQMMTVLQNVTGGGEDQQKDKDVTTRKDEKEETTSSPEPRLSVLKLCNKEKEDIIGNNALELAHIAEWDSVINKVCTILDIEALPVESTRSTDNQEKGSSNKEKVITRASVQLPADGLLVECWKKESVDMAKPTPVTNLERSKYMWPKPDQDAFGYYTKAEVEVVDYLRKVNGSRLALSQQMNRIQGILQTGAQTMRFQQKAISYATYFLAALDKGVNGEKEVEKETLEEIMKNLGVCLMDICDMSVRASSRLLCSRRRIYLDRMNLTNEKAHVDFMALPIGRKMFDGKLDSILEKYKLPIKPTKASKDADGPSQAGGGRRRGRGGPGQASGGARNRGIKRRRGRSSKDIKSPNVKRQKGQTA